VPKAATTKKDLSDQRKTAGATNFTESDTKQNNRNWKTQPLAVKQYPQR
jgi:hypothetical protein